MSKTGKRMWAEKEWILGLSQSKQAVQVRAGGRGLLAKKGNPWVNQLRLKSTAGLEQSTFLKTLSSTEGCGAHRDLQPENCFCHRRKGLESSSSVREGTVYEAHLAELNG